MFSSFCVEVSGGRAVIGLVACLLLPACAPTTTLILMPDESGKLGSITTRSSGEVRVLDKPYERVTTSRVPLLPPSVDRPTEAQVYRDYDPLIKAQSLPSLTFTVYFSRGSADLAENARALIPEIIRGIRARVPAAITIIGHTDTTGTDAINNRLSLERAQTVERVLREGVPYQDAVKMQSFGSRGLIVPTPPNVDEPRNRVVEILIL